MAEAGTPDLAANQQSFTVADFNANKLDPGAASDDQHCCNATEITGNPVVYG